MNYIRARVAAENRNRANNEILGLLKNSYKRQKKKEVSKSKQKIGIFSKAISFKIVFHDDSELEGKSKHNLRRMTIAPIGKGHNIHTVMESKEMNIQSMKSVAQNAVQLTPKYHSQQANVIELEHAKYRNLKESSQIMNFSPAHNSLLFDNQPASNFIWNNSSEEINHNEASIGIQYTAHHQNSDDLTEEDQQTPVISPFFSPENMTTIDFNNIKCTSKYNSNTIPSTFETDISESNEIFLNTPDFIATFDTNPISSSTAIFDAMPFNQTECELTNERIDGTIPLTFNAKDWTNPPLVTYEMFMERKALGARRAYDRLFPEESTTMTDSLFNTQSTTPKSKYKSTPTFEAFKTSNVSVNCKQRFKKESEQRPTMKSQRQPKRFYVDALKRLIREREIHTKSTYNNVNKRMDPIRSMIQPKVPNAPLLY